MSDATTLWLREDETVADYRPRPEEPRGLPWPQRLLLDTVYVLSAFPIAWAMFVVVVTGLALAAGLSVLVGGVLLLPVVVYAARSEAFFERLAPEGMDFIVHDTEGPDDMPAHIRAALTQTSIAIPVAAGAPLLGTWQGLYLFEHRRAPHRRQVVLSLLGG